MSRRFPLHRAIRSLGSLVVGAIVGMTASLYHGIFYPLGLVVTLGIITLCMAGMRTLFVERYPTLWASVGLVSALVLLAGVDGNGSVLIMADTAGLVLLGGATLIVAIAIAWPRFAPRARGYDRNHDRSERIPQP